MSGVSAIWRCKPSSTPKHSSSLPPRSHAGVDQGAARKWWTGEFTRIANEQGVALEDLAVTPAHIARVEALIADGSLTDKLARSVFEGVLAGEGDVDEVISARGLVVVGDDSTLMAAIEQASGRPTRRCRQDSWWQGSSRGRDSRRCYEGHQRSGGRSQGAHLAARPSGSRGIVRVSAGSVLVPDFLAPDGLPDCVTYRSGEVPDDATCSRVGFFVPDYIDAPNPEWMEKLPNLEVVQLPTVGFDAALNHLPAGVTLCNAAGVHEQSTAELARRVDHLRAGGVSIARRGT
jgi:hypothetical protein